MNIVEDYLRRSGDDSIIEGVPFICNEHGFMSYRIDGEVFIIVQEYGNGRYWDREANRLAKENACKIIRGGTKRNPLAFKRKYDYNIVGYILEKEVV